MLTIQHITYTHPDKELLFKDISFSLQPRDKVALIGNNGSGKSTLLKIATGILMPAEGVIQCDSHPYYVPQHFGQFNHLTVAGALQTEEKLNALSEILSGNITETNMAILNDDWTIEERSLEALSFWGLPGLPLNYPMEKLSGGEKTKVFLAGMQIHQPDIILLDEPTNHLDTQSREKLYRFIDEFSDAIMVVSHDRTLLEQLNTIAEIGKQGITVYGGNYSFYKELKENAEQALYLQLEENEKALQKARRTEREALERKQKQDARGQKKHEKEGVPLIFMKKLKNNAESSAAKLKDAHSEKIASLSAELRQSREKLTDIRKMKMNFENSALHTGKNMVSAENINIAFHDQLLWKNPKTLLIRSGERIAIAGANGSGKTTLIRMLLGETEPSQGKINRAAIKSIYIDQDYSLIRPSLSVYEQAELFNDDHLPEHEVKIRLNRYLFHKAYWDKPCRTLSGGEKMRLVLCCLMISNHAPDLFILDEPTNNLDIQNIEILTRAINEYSGTLLVVSHDRYFLEEIGITRTIEIQ